jgi:hypothetical protein
MSHLRIELDFEEGQALRELVLGGAGEEIRLLALLQSGRLVHALRTDTGPVLTLPSRLDVGGPHELRALDEAKGVDRIVTIEADRVGCEALNRIEAGILEDWIRADPPWLPILDSIRSWPVVLRDALAWLLPDGAYALLLQGDDERASILICAQVDAGRVVAWVGAERLGIEVSVADPASLLAPIQQHVGPLQLLVAGFHAPVSRVLTDAHPASALEHASIRGQGRIVHSSRVLGVGLFLARLLGL